MRLKVYLSLLIAAGSLVAGAAAGREAAAPHDPEGLATTVAQLRVAAADGNLTAMNNLGVYYLKGLGVERDLARAKDLFEQAAAEGLAGAMFNLGTVYLRGYGVRQNVKRATRWFYRGAEAGDADAQFFAALHAHEGRGTKRDPELAARWFRAAADAGSANAQYNLAVMYLRGEVVEADESVALEWLHHAAAAGHERAALTIAQIHLDHTDEPERSALGVTLLTGMAENGVPDAQVLLGMLYTIGQNVEQDFEEGRFWLMQAARQRAGAAFLNLGNIYLQGLGTTSDPVRALAWYSLGADAGDPVAADNQTALTEQLSDEQRAAAETLSAGLLEEVAP